MVYEFIGYIFLIWGLVQLFLLILGWGGYFLKSNWIPTMNRQFGIPYIGFVKPNKATLWDKILLFAGAIFSLTVYGIIIYIKDRILN